MDSSIRISRLLQMSMMKSMKDVEVEEEASVACSTDESTSCARMTSQPTSKIAMKPMNSKLTKLDCTHNTYRCSSHLTRGGEGGNCSMNDLIIIINKILQIVFFKFHQGYHCQSFCPSSKILSNFSFFLSNPIFTQSIIFVLKFQVIQLMKEFKQ